MNHCRRFNVDHRKHLIHNAYKILGISKGASPQEIKKAYRKKARKYHPDINTDSDATAKFIEIKDAYEYILCEVSGGHKKYGSGHHHNSRSGSPTQNWYTSDPEKVDIARFITNLEQLVIRSGGPIEFRTPTNKIIQKYLQMNWSLKLVTKINKYATHWQKHRIIELNYYLFESLSVKQVKMVSHCLQRIADGHPQLLEIVKKNKRNGMANTVSLKIANVLAVTFFVIVTTAFLAALLAVLFVFSNSPG